MLLTAAAYFFAEKFQFAVKFLNIHICFLIFITVFWKLKSENVSNLI